MTYEEIIEKLKQSELSFEDFTHENHSYEFEKYPEALKAQKVRKEFRELHCISHKWDSEENQKIYSELPDEYKIITKLYQKELTGLEWVEVEQYGGEGEGDTWYSIKHFPNDDVCIKVDGYYQSYEGVSFDGEYDSCCSQVVPKQKTITVYE